MNIGDYIGLCDAQKVIAALQTAAIVGKEFASEILFRKTVRLNHRAHSAVENQNSLLEKVSEALRRWRRKNGFQRDVSGFLYLEIVTNIYTLFQTFVNAQTIVQSGNDALELGCTNLTSTAFYMNRVALPLGCDRLCAILLHNLQSLLNLVFVNVFKMDVDGVAPAS